MKVSDLYVLQEIKLNPVDHVNIRFFKPLRDMPCTEQK